jgi:hypothetical protein
MFHSDSRIQEAKDRQREHEQAIKNHRVANELNDKGSALHKPLLGIGKFAVRSLVAALGAAVDVGKAILSLFHKGSLKHAG